MPEKDNRVNRNFNFVYVRVEVRQNQKNDDFIRWLGGCCS
jgi:hypothetical protein